MKRKSTLTAKFGMCVSTTALLMSLSACGPSDNAAPTQDCMSAPESCQAPNLCVEDANGAYVCIRPSADATMPAADARITDASITDCRNDGVGCIEPATCEANADGSYGCQTPSTPTDAGITTDLGVDAAVELDQGIDAMVTGPIPAEPPEAPPLSENVSSIVVSIKTADLEYAGTDDPMEICFGRAGCYELNVLDVDDRERGETEVYHFETQKPRALFDEVTLRTTDTSSNNNRWTPECLEVRFNGEPVHCQNDLPNIGTDNSGDEVRSFTQSLGNRCNTCWSSGVTHGPMIGPPSADGVSVWFRADATRLVGLRIGTSEDLTDAPVVDWVYPTVADDFTAVLHARNLAPDTMYYYRVEVDGDASQTVRSIRTAPATETPARLRIGLGSCSRLDDQPIFNSIFAQQPDLFLFMGDNHYANTHHLDALRWHYRRFRNLPERAALLANVPTMATWDDHDFLANNSNGTCLNRDYALDAFVEYWANPAAGLPATPGVFFNYRYGPVELFMLDCRMYRPDIGDSGLRCEVDPTPPQLSRDDGPLGLAQEAWLREQLNASTADFKLIGCGSRFTPEGSTDSWASYNVARNRLLNFIDSDGIEGVAFLSGDIHRSSFGVVPSRAYDIPEFTSSPLAYADASPCPSSADLERFCYDDGNSFVTLDVDTTGAEPTLTGRVHNQTGRVMHEWTVRRSELQ